MSINAFIDVRNQNYYIDKKWPGRRLDFRLYKTILSDIGTINRAFAYGTYSEDRAKKFISVLYHLGYEPKFNKVPPDGWFSWDVNIAIDIVRLSDRCDTVILGNSNTNMLPVINWAMCKGLKVIVVGCNIHPDVRSSCDRWIEISEDMLEDDSITTTAE